MNAARDAAAATRATAVERLLFAGWWIALALLPIGHVTGLRNTWTTFVVLCTLLWLRRDAWRDLPARVPLLALLIWCAASIGWSTSPAVSFGKWQVDLLLPVCAYAAAFGYVRRTGSYAALVGGVVTGMVSLAGLSAFAFLPVDWRAQTAVLPWEAFANVAAPLPVWYPGVGDASMAASLAAAVLVCAHRLIPGVPRSAWVVGWLAVVVAVLASNNRNAAIAIPVVVGLAVLAERRNARRTDPGDGRSTRRLVAMLLVASVVVVAGLATMLELSARERLRVIGRPVAADRSALVELTTADTRPMIWRYYTRLALREPIAGVGFGRTVPGIHYHTQDDGDLARVEFNAYIHAHNLFLNWWLQTGVVGVALLVWTLVEVVRAARRRARAGHAARVTAALVSIYALLGLMLVRDMTDDFMVFGMATMFWSLLGGMSGLREGSTRAVELQ